ncbi:MAG: hypothetical protein A3F42_06880 [Gammaproteobacteria bacterium RIFCSPHIGHO2_12_FULL_37_34]|nr:MAG: hypothetical protein A3F42_06880 [Gammaproteobacteria bacterium RIFCSPHIGHO2_12_FULL_37_34]
MMLKKLIQFSTLFFIFSSILFASQTKSAITTKNDLYTERSLNIVVTKAHPEFTLQLKSNPTTGYSWFLREYSRNLIKPLKHSYQKSVGNLIGAPGYELWTFQVNPAGFVVPQHTTIRMIYARPWQGIDNSTQLVFRVTML